jgi:hypothetical protein
MPVADLPTAGKWPGFVRAVPAMKKFPLRVTVKTC